MKRLEYILAIMIFVSGGCTWNTVGDWNWEARTNVHKECLWTVRDNYGDVIEADPFCTCVVDELEARYHPFDLNDMFYEYTQYLDDYEDIKEVKHNWKMLEEWGGTCLDEALKKEGASGTKWNPMQMRSFRSNCERSISEGSGGVKFEGLDKEQYCDCLTMTLSSKYDFDEINKLPEAIRFRLSDACQAAAITE